MSTDPNTPGASKLLTALGATFVALLVVGLVVVPSHLQAQSDDGADIVVGTYDAQQLAQRAGLQQQMMQEMQGLQQRMQKAQQDQDQQAMQAIQAEAQKIQQDVTSQFLADVEAVMPDVAEQSGAHVIATEVTYTTSGVTTEDVTQLVADAMELEPPQTTPPAMEGAEGTESDGPSEG